MKQASRSARGPRFSPRPRESQPQHRLCPMRSQARIPSAMSCAPARGRPLPFRKRGARERGIVPHRRLTELEQIAAFVRVCGDVAQHRATRLWKWSIERWGGDRLCRWRGSYSEPFSRGERERGAIMCSRLRHDPRLHFTAFVGDGVRTHGRSDMRQVRHLPRARKSQTSAPYSWLSPRRWAAQMKYLEVTGHSLGGVLLHLAYSAAEISAAAFFRRIMPIRTVRVTHLASSSRFVARQRRGSGIRRDRSSPLSNSQRIRPIGAWVKS